MVPPEISYAMTARHEYSNTAKAQETDFKNNFKKMIEVLKKGIKNSLKEVEKRQQQNFEEIKKFLKTYEKKAKKNYTNL